jgi:hypothetical protein
MPTLEITNAGLAPEAAPMTLNYLLGIMIWPAECDARREFLRTLTAQRRRDLFAVAPETADPAEILEVMDELASVRSPESLKENMQSRIERGSRVGEEFAAAIGIATWVKPGSLVSIKNLRWRMTTSQRRAAHPAMNVGEKQLEKDSREFRAVCHLWGALHINNIEQLGLFCPSRLAEFLSLSEWVRSAGLRVRTKKGDPLLAPGSDSWRPPISLELPHCSLSLPPH